jgi:hypothetical protein
MIFFSLRSLTATSLSLWLGVLACLLGCAKPTTAAEQRPSPEASMGVCPQSKSNADEPCCQHGHDAPGRPDNKSDHANSCCPTETALTQKETLTAPPLVVVHAVALTLPSVGASPMVFTSLNASAPTLWQAGRDILRQVHVLRI